MVHTICVISERPKYTTGCPKKKGFDLKLAHVIHVSSDSSRRPSHQELTKTERVYDSPFVRF